MSDQVVLGDQPAASGAPSARTADASATRAADPVRDIPAARPPSRARRWLSAGLTLYILMLAAALAVVVAYEWDWWVGSAVLQTTDDAYLQADVRPLAAQVPGYVRAVPVRDFQTVKAGQTLVEIVDDDYRARLDQAAANVAAARAALTSIQQQKILQATLIKQAEATIQGTEADLVRYRLEAWRQETLLRTRIAGTQQITDQAVDNEQHTEATLSLNQAQLAQQQQQLNVLDSQEKQAQANIAGQIAAYDLARINLGYTRITAPVDGMVGQRLVLPGQYLSTGTQVISIVPLPHVWVIANYMETQLQRIRLGEPATVTVDTFPGVVLHGHVDSWSPASGAEFALLPPDNATGNFTKVVQRIPVKIVLDPDPAVQDLLRPGMSVIATIDTRSAAPPAAGADTR
ncbi:MAG TPA: HlyD family secretion protein [Acetobacteraceae bacterium]|nr:HlyD family secretion protein [Acetobacteraceae bacterium]